MVKNNILVSDIIEATIEGKADCQPREWKALENGTRRVIYLYGLYDIYPLSEGIKLSSQAAQLQLPVETHFIGDGNDASLAALSANIQQEIRALLSTTEQGNAEVRNNLNTLVQQEMQLLQNSGVTERKEALKSKFVALTSQMNSKRLDLVAKRKAFEVARQKFWDHLNGEQRIEIVTQSDLERNRSQDVIKAKLMSECLTQFRTTVKSLYSQEKDKVVNFQLAENSAKNMFRQVQLKAAKVLGIYLSPSEGDIKYTASVAFRFGFGYTQTSIRLRSKGTVLMVDDVKAMLKYYDFYCMGRGSKNDWDNPEGKDITNIFELLHGGNIVFDQTTGLMWQQSGSPDNRLRYANAEEYIQKLNMNRFAGFNDWRLPTLEEAMSLIERQQHGELYIDPIFDQIQDRIWTVDKNNVGLAWKVYLRGSACYYDGALECAVRALRTVP